MSMLCSRLLFAASEWPKKWLSGLTLAEIERLTDAYSLLCMCAHMMSDMMQYAFLPMASQYSTDLHAVLTNQVLSQYARNGEK